MPSSIAAGCTSMVDAFRILFRVLGFVLGLCGLVLFIAWHGSRERDRGRRNHREH